ncbi:hypothetical protein D3C78_301920 [compost metagenome]
MAKNPLEICHVGDVHVVAIWPGDGIVSDDYTVYSLYHTGRHHVEMEKDMVLLFADRVANLSAPTPAELIPQVERLFPHLKNVGCPVVNDNGQRSTFETWTVYADDEGLKHVNAHPGEYGYMLDIPDNVTPIA